MALVLCFCAPRHFSSSSSWRCSFSSSSTTLAVTATPISRLHLSSIGQNPTTFTGIQSFVPLNARKNGVVIVRASSETDETAPKDAVEPPSESVPIDKLPLESKLQERMEQKLKMKMAKKIRQRRNRLVRKRRMRKKGRWPPSKMKKLKNV